MNPKEIEELIEKAFLAREKSYSPYSHFMVGVALLTKSGNIYTGCNVENAAYTPTNCAERTAVFKAISEGEKEFAAIAIIGGKKDATELDYCAPCGVCRQVLMEFCDENSFQVILAKSSDEYCVYSLKELFPMGFGPKNLQMERDLL